MRTARPNEAPLAPMNDMESRGADFKRRRLALGIVSLNKFHQASGIDRETLGKAEAGTASATKMDEIEAWLTRQEAENGHAGADEAAPLKLTLHGVYGIEEMIFEGPADRPDELAHAVGLILERFKGGERRP